MWFWKTLSITISIIAVILVLKWTIDYHYVYRTDRYSTEQGYKQYDIEFQF